MDCIESLALTVSARHSIKAMGLVLGDVLVVIQRLSMGNFYKAMTVHTDNRVWQDVYHAEWRGKGLYIKFQKCEEYFIVSFKER